MKLSADSTFQGPSFFCHKKSLQKDKQKKHGYGTVRVMQLKLLVKVRVVKVLGKEPVMGKELGSFFGVCVDYGAWPG